MAGNTFDDDSIIQDILKRNLGKKNAQIVFKSLSGTYDADSIILSLKKTLKGRIPETRLEKLVKEFSDAKTILPGTHPETSVETKASSSTVTGAEPKKYNIKDELGRGGMGTVYSAEDLSLDRRIALKTGIGSPNDSKVRRFIREAKITAKLEHPNIIPVHDHGINSKGEYYFTMKQVKGEELKEILDKLAKGKRSYCAEYTLNKQLQIFNKILDGVGFAHSKGIIHRDLKPANIMVGEFGEVQIMDWGLAKDKSAEDIIADGEIESTEKGLTMDGAVMGSPGFMAPEQADGRIEDVDEQSDIWSLGAILYNMLSFKNPVEGKSVRDIVTKTALGKIIHLNKRLKASKKTDVPKELESIAMKALSPEKEDRYQSATDFKQDINSHLENRPVSAHRHSLVQRISKWAQRHPTLAMSSSVASLFLIAGLGVAGFLYQKAETARSEADKAGLAKKLAEKEREVMKKEKEEMKDERDAAQLEVKGQQQCEAALNSLKFLKQDEDYYDAAVSVINNAIKISENFWKPYLVLAKHQADFGRHEQAERLFKEANEIYRKQFNKDSVEILFEAGMYYGLPTELGGRGLENKALEYFKKANQADPDKTFGKLASLLGLVIESKIKPKKAEKNLSQATELSDILIKDKIAKSIDATWLSRAWAYGISTFTSYQSPVFSKFADFKKARHALCQVVDEEHGKIMIRTFLASVEADLGEFDTSIRILSNCMKIRRMTYLLNNRGTVFHQKREFEKAISDFDEAIKSNPRNALYYYNRGSAHENKGELEKAITDYNQAIRLNPGFWLAYNNRGLVYYQKGEFEKAIMNYSKAIRLNPRFAEPYNNRGRVYQRRNELEKAITDFNEAIKINPEFAEPYNNRGVIYKKQGELEKAIADYNTAIRLNPDYVEPYSNRGVIYYQKGEFEKAITDFNKAITLNPHYWQAHHNKAYVLSKKEQYQEAIDAYQDALKYAPASWKNKLQAKISELKEKIK